MGEFFQLLGDPSAGFLRNALAAGLISSVAFGVVGTYVVVRRIGSIAGAVAHSVLGGIGAAIYAQERLGWDWCSPTLGAFAAALLSALIIGLVSIHAKEREDTIIAAIWSIGMAVGAVFLAKADRSRDLMSYLLGDILIVSQSGLGWLIALDALAALVGIAFYHKLVAICFDAEFARLRGVRANLWYLVLLSITAVSIVLLARLVGIILVIALLVVPAAAASHFAKRLWQMMLLAVLFCMASTTFGLSLSVSHDLPSGPAIALVAGAIYVAVLGGFWAKRRMG